MDHSASLHPGTFSSPPARPAADGGAVPPSPWGSIIAFGVLVNLLVLSSPVFMLQLYDRVLPAGSGATLAVLLALTAFLTALQALIDAARTRLLMRAGARLQARVEVGHQFRGADPPDTVFRVFAQGAVMALMDAPWALIFAAILFWIHPLLGWVAVGGASALAALVALSTLATADARHRAQRAEGAAQSLSRALAAAPDHGRAMDMAQNAATLWRQHRSSMREATLDGGDRAALLTATARHLRAFLQVAVLAAGGWLVIQGQLSPGLMIAASILQGRALLPVEALVGQANTLQQAWQVWRSAPRAEGRASPPPTPAPGPLVLEGVLAGPMGAGRPALQIDRLVIDPGTAVGVIGDSGAGKSLLAQVLAGGAPLRAGRMTLGGMALPLAPGLGGLMGFLPDTPVLLPGTVADNIARHPGAAPPRAQVEATLATLGLTRAVQALPQGLDTPIDSETGQQGGPNGGLTGGLRQGIALARAFHGAPRLIVLDEPATHLDAAATGALNRAIRAAKARGAIVVVMAHRPSVLAECDSLLVLDAGAQVAFGPRDDVLRKTVRNHTALVPQATPRPDPAA